MVLDQPQIWMLPHRFRPTDEGLNPVVMQIFAKFITPMGTNDIVLVRVPIGISRKMGQAQVARACKALAIALRNPTSVFDPLR